MAAWYVGITFFALVLSLVVTAIARKFLERFSIIDQPNSRSIHNVPVPRGGGLAIAFVVLIVHGGVIALELMPVGTGSAWWFAGAAFTLLGWWDDLRPRPAWQRFLAQIAIATGFVLAVEPTLFPSAIFLQFGVAVFIVVGVVNLFNFMDGADGFAASQAGLYAAAGAAILVMSDQPGVALVALAVAGSAVGFLRWNWFPASLFMGDSGSYFLGFQCAAFAILSGQSGPSTTIWLILLMPFVVDASLTLVRRVYSGARWWQAHQEHAYQRLLLGSWRPSALVAGLILVNVLVCWPLAALAIATIVPTGLAVVLAFGINATLWLTINQRYKNTVGSKDI